MQQRPKPIRPPEDADPAPRASGSPDAGRFVREVEPLLEANDLPGLIAHLDARYDAPQICSLLNSDLCDARKCAALALALVGRGDCVESLAAHLRDADPMVNEMAEHALWSVWFRGGDGEANARVVRGCEALGRQNVAAAEAHFSAAVARCPCFAEAWNQRAIVRYLLEEFDASLTDCRRAVDLMPCHFGAWAGVGHCLASQGDYPAALEAYRRALAINPHLDCVAETVRSLERRAARADAADGLLDGGDDDLRIVADGDKSLCDWDAEDWLDELLDDDEPAGGDAGRLA